MRRIGITLQLSYKADNRNYCFLYKKMLLASAFLFTTVTSSLAQATNDSIEKSAPGLLKQPLAVLKDSQQKLPVIKASSKKVDIRDGNIFQKGIWNLSPEIKPDVYTVINSLDKEKKVTFYTDIDSISFNVSPGAVYDFIVLLNNKDTCYVRASALIPKTVIYDKTALIEPALLKQDFSIFRKALEQEHAGLYRYKSKNEITKAFNNCFAKLDHDITEIEYFNILRYMIGTIEDGHTSCNLPSEVMDYYNVKAKMFPALIRFINNKAYILCSSGKSLPPGTEIVTIDHQPINKLKEQLFKYLPSDGKIETKKSITLTEGGFNFIYNWVNGEKDIFTVSYLKDGKLQTTVLNADVAENIDCLNNGSSGKNLQIEYKKNHIALLTIKTFSSARLNGAKEDFRGFLQSAFKEINSRKVKSLIIDLRDNSGGDDIFGTLLYSYLANKPFKYFASVASTTRELTERDIPGLAIQQPNENNFKGMVFFLTNGRSFSTTADVCAIAKSNGRGEFIGEETGGGYNGNTSGEIDKIILPNTKIIVSIPKLRYISAVKKTKYKDRGTIPDYIIVPSINDYLQHKDVQMEFVLKLAAKE